MLFNSLAFLAFFPTVLLIFHLSPRSLRSWWLLVSSAVFYGYGTPWHLILIIFVIAIAYAGSRLIEARPAHKKYLLVIALILLLAPLGLFKYLPFVYTVITDKDGAGFPVLPVGISFFTFQGLGYIIDVYRGQRAEKKLIPTSLFILFFPQLVAGPIERAGRLIKQFKEFSKVSYDEMLTGFSLMVWGLFKKIVVADRLAMVVNEVYSHPQEFGGIYLILATAFFSPFRSIVISQGIVILPSGPLGQWGLESWTTLTAPILRFQYQNFGENGIYPFRPGFEIISISH